MKEHTGWVTPITPCQEQKLPRFLHLKERKPFFSAAKKWKG